MDSPPREINAELVIVSDTHIRSAEDVRLKTMMQGFNQIGSGVRYLVFLGDIFDFCFGYSKLFSEEFRELKLILGKLKARGIKILFIEGNHEFQTQALQWDEVEFVSSHDLKIELSDGRIVLLGHGDLINAPVSYRVFRWFIKSRFAAFVARLVPDRIFNNLALRLADSSRSMDKYRQLDHRTIANEAKKWFRASRADLGFFGHFHVPYAISCSREKPEIFSCRSWIEPNFMVCHDGRVDRYIWNQAKSLFEVMNIDSSSEIL